MAFFVSLEEYDCLIAERINSRGLPRPPCDIRKAACFETGIRSHPYRPHSIRILFFDWISCTKSVMPAYTRITGAYLPPLRASDSASFQSGDFGWAPMVCIYVWGVEPHRHRLEALACVSDFSVFCKFSLWIPGNSFALPIFPYTSSYLDTPDLSLLALLISTPSF